MPAPRPANRRQHKTQQTADAYVQRYAYKYAIASRSLMFRHADGVEEQVTVSLFQPHDVAPRHWRCPYWIEGATFKDSGYASGADSMQALILATQIMPNRLQLLERSRQGVFTCDGQSDLGFPPFGA